MHKKDIVIGAIYKLKNVYGYIKPIEIIKANACGNPNPFTVVKCETKAEPDDLGIVVICYKRLSAFSKQYVERILK